MAIHEKAYQETLAKDMHGFLTKLAWITNNVILLVLIPLSLLNPVTTIILGLLGMVNFKIALIPFYGIGFFMFGWLLGTS